MDACTGGSNAVQIEKIVGVPGTNATHGTVGMELQGATDTGLRPG